MKSSHPKLIYSFHAMWNRIPEGNIVEFDLKIYIKIERTHLRVFKTILKKENKLGRLILSNLKTYCKLQCGTGIRNDKRVSAESPEMQLHIDNKSGSDKDAKRIQ